MMDNKDFHNQDEDKKKNNDIENKETEDLKEKEEKNLELEKEIEEKKKQEEGKSKELENEEELDEQEEKKKEVKKILSRGRSKEEKPNQKGVKNTKISINFKNIILLIFLVILIISLPNMFSDTAPKRYEDVTYTHFIEKLEAGNFARIEEKEGYLYAESTLEGQINYKTKMITNRISEDEKIMSAIENKEIVLRSLEADKLPFLVSILVSWFPMLLLIFVWIFMLNRMNKGSSGGGGGPQIFNMGKSKAKEGGEGGEKVTFNDVAGADEAKLELLEIVQFLKEPRMFQEIGARIPKGVLLKGLPGTGKTLLAKAVAGEAGVPFFSISGSEFVEMFVGVGASRVRDLFGKARKAAPCIVFIDEIDAVGRKRGSGQGGGNDEREQTLNQLLVEMDGFGNDETIIVIAATNRDEILDKALMRPGRFDRQVTVDAPDIIGREAILNVHIRGKKLGKNVDIKRIARKTAGFVGADLANMLNEAAIMAARAGRKIITMADIEEATEKVAYGPAKKSKVIHEKEKKTIAYHEAGHALVNVLLDHTIPAYKVTIIPRGGAGGYLMQIPTEEKMLHMKNEMLANIRVAYGGRVSEELIFDDISSGASGDIMQATATAIHMVTRLGMAGAGKVLYDATRDGDYYKNHTFYSQETGRELDNEIRKILDEAYEDTKKLISENMDALHRIASALLEYETITGEELEKIVHDQTGQVGFIDTSDKDEKIAKVEELIASDKLTLEKNKGTHVDIVLEEEEKDSNEDKN